LKKPLEFTLIILILLIYTKIYSQDIKYTVSKTNSPPIIDGKMDDLWSSIPVIDEFYSICENEYETSPDDEMDASLKFKILWDDTYLYFYAETFNDTLHKDRVGWQFPKRKGSNDDCFENILDCDYSRGNRYDGKTEGEI